MVAGTGDGDLLWKAQVIDDTFTFFQRFDDNLNRIANASEQQFQRVDASVRSSGKEIGLVAGIVGGLTTKLVEMGMQAAGALKGFISESINLRARVDTLGVALENVGNRAGYSDEQLAKFEKDVKGMGITTKNARQSLLQMAQANLDLGMASEVARVAQDAAVIAGVNSSEAFQRIVTAVQRLNPIMLRQLGLTVNMQEEYKRFAAAQGTVAKSLTYQQKQQIALNAVMRAGEDIAGTYESAMGSVGKQITSLPRYIEEVQLALGEAFQPALSAQISFVTDKLKELLKWLQENRDQIQQFAERLGMIMQKLFEFADGLVTFISKIPGYIEEAGSILAKAVGQALDVASPEEIEARRSKLGEYFGQAVTLLASFVATGAKMVTEFIGLAGDAFMAFLKMIGLVEGSWQEAVDNINTRLDNFGATIQTTFEDSMLSVGEFMGTIEVAGDEMGDAADDADELGGSVDKMAEAVASATSEFEKLRAEMAEEAAKRAVEAARKAEIEALRLSHRMEDIERRHIERIERIREQAAKARERALADASKAEHKLAEKHAQDMIDLDRSRSRKRIDVEVDFRRRIQAINRDFDYEAGQAARRGDAIALLDLMQAKKREIEEAGIAREQEREDINTDYKRRSEDLRQAMERDRAEMRRDFQERLQELDKNLQEQLQKAEGQRMQDIENLARSLERQRQIQAIHDRHAAEDRQRELNKKLADLGQNFAQMEGMTEDALARLLAEWGEYFGDLTALQEAFAATFYNNMTPPAPGSPGYTGYAPGVFPPGMSWFGGSGYITGQAGQVSQLLVPQFNGGTGESIRAPMISPLPAVSPRTTTEVREIKLSGDVSGMEPFIQRILVNGLLEIERNRG